MTPLALVTAIIALIPKGLDALTDLRTVLTKWVDDQKQRDFLEGCVDMCRDILIDNPGLPFADQQRYCADAIREYGINCGQNVDAALKMLGTEE